MFTRPLTLLALLSCSAMLSARTLEPEPQAHLTSLNVLEWTLAELPSLNLTLPTMSQEKDGLHLRDADSDPTATPWLAGGWQSEGLQWNVRSEDWTSFLDLSSCGPDGASSLAALNLCAGLEMPTERGSLRLTLGGHVRTGMEGVASMTGPGGLSGMLVWSASF